MKEPENVKIKDENSYKVKVEKSDGRGGRLTGGGKIRGKQYW